MINPEPLGQSSEFRIKGLAFDGAKRDCLFVVDSLAGCVRVYSLTEPPRVLDSIPCAEPSSVTLDHERQRLLVTSSSRCAVAVYSLVERAFLFEFSTGMARFADPRQTALDHTHDRIIVADTSNHRLQVRNASDGSFLFSVGKHGYRSGHFSEPAGVAIDHDRHRIIVTDSNNHRVQVLSSIDGSFLFEFGSKGNQPCQLKHPQATCVDNQGRIIVADFFNHRLQSFTHEGHHISSFDCGGAAPFGVAFDEHRGLIAFSTGHRVHVIGANQWLADTFTWRVDRHRYAPSWMKQAVSTMTMIRSVVDESSAMSKIPNELLFEIFSWL